MTVAFIITRTQDIICLESLVRQYAQAAAQRLCIYLNEDASWQGPLQAATEKLKENAWNCAAYSPELLQQDRPDLVFLSNPYMSGDIYDFIPAQGCKMVYIPYGDMTVEEEDITPRHCNQPVHSRAWRMYTLSELHKQTYAKYSPARGRNIRVIRTTPKFDVSRALCAKKPVQDIPAIYLWNMHFHLLPVEEERKVSAFFEYAAAIFDFFNTNRKAFLRIRPHPQLKALLDSPQHILSSFLRLPNVMLEESWNTGYEKSFAMADALLTDQSSLMYDFMVSGKPVLLLRNENIMRMHPFVQTLAGKYIYVTNTADEFTALMNNLRQGRDALRQNRRDMLSKNEVFDLSRSAAAIIEEDINSSLATGE